MNNATLVTGCLLAVALVHGETGSYEVKRTFLSPDGSVTAGVAAQPSTLGRERPPIHSLGTVSNGSFVPFIELPLPRYFREYHGRAWFQDVQPRWIGGQFLIFEDGAGVAIADVQNRRMLVNHVFTGYEKSPIDNKWAAIRLRATGRDQESLDANFQDTVLVIDPYDVANRIANATEENFVGQMKVANPGGIVLAKPQWASDGSAFSVLTWNRGIVEAVRYNANLNQTGRTAVKLKVDRESALSLSLNPTLAQAAKSILSDPTIFH